MKTARGLLRTIEWDAVYHHFVTKETIHLGDQKMILSASWDYSLNLQTKSTSLNGENVFYSYDDFGRLLSIRRSEDAADKPSMTVTYEMKAPLSRIITRRRSRTNGDLDILSVQCFDGLGRKLATANRLKDNEYLVSDHRTYNAQGIVSRQWNTYTSPTDCQFSPPDAQNPKQTNYDALGRVIKMTFEDGSFSRKEYSPLRVTSYDPEDNRPDSPHYNTPTIQITDGQGRAIEEIKTLSTTKALSTKYEHTNIHMLGQSLMKRVTFADGSTKTHTYDLLGRIRKLEDPDRSTIEYVLDEEGNTIERRESDGKKILSTYDLLNRLLTRQLDGKPETKIAFSYDTPQQILADATYTKGQITQITFPIGSYNYSYDVNGNLNRAIYIINGQSFAFSAQFDNLNRLIEETFPDGRKLSYERDPTGRLLNVSGQINNITYSADTTPRTISFANGIETTYAFDTRQRLQSINVGGEKVMELRYTLDSTGNINAIEQSHGGSRFTHRYTTDALYRLTKAELGGDQPEEITYTYDDLHNTRSRLSSLGEKSPIHLGDFSYDKKQIHALRQAGKRTLSYDAHGNMIQDGDLAYQWDFLHRRTQIQKGQEILGRTWYGPNAARLIKEEHGVHTHYITPNYEIRDGRAIIYTTLGSNKVVAWSAPQGATQIFRDLAPATGETTLTSKPDGQLTAADAWLFYAGRQKLLSIDLPKQTHDLDYTKDYLQASLSRMLDGDKEQKHYYHPDHLGSVRAVTNDQGEVIARKDYYPYGYIRKKEGDFFSFGFQNTERDALTGANYFNSRFLDTHLGRWISADPLFEQIQSTEDEFNSFGMTAANPINNRDINGTESEYKAANSMDYAAFGAAAAIGVWELYKNVQAFRKAGKDDSLSASDKKNIRRASVTSGVLTGIGMFASMVALAQQAWKGGYDGDLAQGVAGGAIALAVMADSVSTTISLRNNLENAKTRQQKYVNGLTGRDKAKIGLSVTGSVLLLLASGATAVGGVGQMNLFGQEGKFWVTALTIAGAVASLGGIAAKMSKGGMQRAEKMGFREGQTLQRKNSTSYGFDTDVAGKITSNRTARKASVSLSKSKSK